MMNKLLILFLLLASLAGLAPAIRRTLAPVGERVHAFAHLSHVYPSGSSVYVTYVFRLASDPDETLRRWRTIKDAASRTVVEQLYSDKLFASDPTDCPTVPLLPANRRAVPGLTTKYFLCTANQLALEYGWYEGGPTVTQYPEWKSDSLIWHCRDIFGIGVIRHQDFACDSGTGA